MAANSQKFIDRNRAPRVQIEYDLDAHGDKQVELPFVAGVMADLSGKSAGELPDIESRKMVEIDVDNFDSRMKAAKPTVSFAVPNTLTGEGNLAVNLTFENMDDFSPAAVAAKVDGLKEIFQARQDLSNLLSYIDGKGNAEKVLNQLLNDPNLIKAMASTPKPADE